MRPFASGAELIAILRFVLPFACLYASFGLTFGLIGTGAQLLFRARGAPLAEVGWIQIIYLPVGLTFLWAGLVDRVRLPGFSPRVGWIVATQATTAALLLALSLGTDWPLTILGLLVMATSFAAATMDIALEALVVDTIAAVRRHEVTTAKLCGSAIGGMLGIGLVTILPLSLSAALVLVAALDALCLLPILRYPEAPRAMATREARPNLGRRLRAILGHAAILGVYFGATTMVSDADGLALLDLHVALPVVGLLTGPFGRTVQIVMTLAAGALAVRVEGDRLVLALAGGVVLAGLLMALATATCDAALGIVAMAINAIFAAGLGVPVFTMIYRWAEGARAATDYALLFGVAFLAAMPARVGGPALAGLLGWPVYFVICVPLYAIAVALLVGAMARTRHGDAAAC